MISFGYLVTVKAEWFGRGCDQGEQPADFQDFPEKNGTILSKSFYIGKSYLHRQDFQVV